MDLYRMTMIDFEAGLARTRTAILPCGSVEEHGSHLPLGTDTLQIHHVALEAARREPAFVCPPLHYGYCRSTADHPGTVSISADTLRRLVVDIGTSLISHGVRGLILASGHAGGIHMASLEEAGEHLLARHTQVEIAVVCEYHWAQEAGRTGLVETGDDGHAGEIETSRILALEPGLVTGAGAEEYPKFAKPFLARDKRGQWPGGVWGDPSKASAEAGMALFHHSVARMAELIRAMAARVAG